MADEELIRRPGCGVGRGRGWLNLNKLTLDRPGNMSNAAPHQNHCSLLAKELDKLNTNYPNMLALLEKLDPNDDGILLNQKLKHIEKTWAQKCTTGAEIEESVKSIYSRCLQDSNFATKIVTMISSYSFISTTIYDIKIRNAFICHMQNDFENYKQLQTLDPVAFHNSVRMLGEFYHKARNSTGRIIKFLARPLIKYLEILLESAQPADLELFTGQLNLNGAAIKSDYPQNIQDILMKVRHVLIYNDSLTRTCRVWLLLALDVFGFRFGLFPADIYKFYQDHLGDKAMANFQGTHSALSIQTFQSNKSLDSYQSHVNVLQVTPPESTSPSENANNLQQFVQPDYGSANNYNIQNVNCDISEWEDGKDNKAASNREKIGRPILGVGARLQKYRAGEECENSKWSNTNKDNSGGWDSSKKMGGKVWGNGTSKRNSSKNNKGWEHDDRFENDY